MKYTANYNLKKPEGTDVVNIDDLNENADILDQKLKEVENKADNAPPNSVNDAAIGSRTPDQSQAPTSPGTGTLTQLISWLANRIKAITGKTNWWDAPPTTLQAAKTHMDAAAPHSGHETPSGAQTKANAAEANAKGYTDTHAGTKNTHGVGSGYYIAKTSRSDQLPAWNDVQGKPSNFTPSAHKSTHASGGSDALTPSDIGAETPAGALAKAEAAAGAVQAELAAHKADGASHSKTARFVVGTSTAGWTLEDCDYLCDGTKDQEEIIQALNDLPATGGEVVILDGTYNITASINVPKDNVSLRGNGNATILKRRFNSSVKGGVITLTNRSGCKIANLQIDGNKASYTNSNNSGIYLGSSSSDNTITGNTCNNNSNGIFLDASNNNTVTGNTCNNNNYGIRLNGSSDNAVTGNACNSNNDGFYLTSSSNNNTLTGNTCNNNSRGFYLTSSSNNTVIGNICNNNNSRGIYLTSSSNNNTLTGNTCNNNDSGIYLVNSSSNTVTGNTCKDNNNEGIYLNTLSNSTITGNICIRGTGLSTDYTESQYTIRLYGTGNSYNLISSNNCMGKDVVIGGGTSNTSVNNKYN